MSTELAGPALLFCPADRPDRFAKAAERADVVILDLEDAVAPDAKAAAREHVAASRLDPDRTIVRVNACGTADHTADVAALARTSYRTVMVAKAEDPAAVGLLDFDVIALVETPLGVLRAASLAEQRNVVGLMWGAEDLVAGLGGGSSRFGPDEARPGAYRDVPRHARASVRLAAGAFGRFAIDAVHVDIADVDGLHAEAIDAVELGFAATACIHPSQVATVRVAYAPTDVQVTQARDVLAAAAAAGTGVFSHAGRMIDGPLLAQARAVLARAAAAERGAR